MLEMFQEQGNDDAICLPPLVRNCDVYILPLFYVMQMQVLGEPHEKECTT